MIDFLLDIGFTTELIGEEIYDEFDPEGGQASYVPPEIHQHQHHFTHPALRKKVSAPQLSPTKDAKDSPAPARVPSNEAASPAPGTKSLSTTPVPKPIALKGLSIITNRSRSAPPTPRDPKPATGIPVVAARPPRTTSPESTHAQGVPLAAALEDAEDGSYASVLGAQETVDLPTFFVDAPGSDPATGTVPKPKANATTPVAAGLLAPASAVPGSVAASRSGSPAPSLEAILLDRKRRLAASQTQTQPQIPMPIAPTALALPAPESRIPNPRASTAGVKGTRFKSTPLAGFDRHGVVVAEQVKEDIRSRNNDPSREDVRIPDDKDKVGPDEVVGHTS